MVFGKNRENIKEITNALSGSKVIAVDSQKKEYFSKLCRIYGTFKKIENETIVLEGREQVETFIPVSSKV